jgi:tRNA threonylcarbamoyladenosine biosynthesis protein TsaB
LLTLAIDTSADFCSAAVFDDAGGRVAAMASRQTAAGHAEHLMAVLAEALAAAGIRYPQIGRVAAVRGPGSFTGIRIGLATARGVALARAIPALGNNALAAHAEAAREIAGADRSILAVIDARRGQVYAQLFGGREAADWPAPMLATPGDVLARVPAALRHRLQLCGAAASRLDSGLPTPVHAHGAPDIAIVARLAAHAEPRACRPEPLYVRPPDAKPQTGMAIERLSPD